MRESIIVSRHPGAVAWIKKQFEKRNLCVDDIPVKSEVDVEDVAGRIVYGNIPMWIAAHAYAVVAIEFKGKPPRGSEYGIKEMEEAGAQFGSYRVLRSDYENIVNMANFNYSARSCVTTGDVIGNGALVLLTKPYSKIEGQGHLQTILARWGNEFVVWTFNNQTKGCSSGRYFPIDDVELALDEWRKA